MLLLGVLAVRRYAEILEIQRYLIGAKLQVLQFRGGITVIAVKDM